MIHEQMELNGTQIDAYQIPCGDFNIVFAATGSGLVGCGAFDVAALDKFEYPAAKVTGAEGGPVVTVEDLLEATVVQLNKAAAQKGVEPGETGENALYKLVR
ncbi:MAG: DUF1805 domain-containing protein [Chitinivibrionales bacterium]|nr:DUF1805 domain-containing protein [Chitinivibrionales bacterium]